MSKSIIPKHEHIRVVPLFQPKVKVDLKGLTAEEQKEPSDVYDPNHPNAAPANAKLVYNGGVLLPNVEVFTVFWGKQYTATGALAAYPAKLNAFFDSILQSTLMDQMAEYNTPKYKFGKGKRTGTITITAGAPKAGITDSAIQTQIKAWIAGNKAFPQPGKNTLYFLYLESGVTVTMGGSKSCSSFCGYHNNIGANTFYAVMPFPTCSGCLGGNNAFDALTGTTSHELCEAVTDAVPGAGWYDKNNGEIGDICAWQFKKVNGYNVQLEWSNKAKKCV